MKKYIPLIVLAALLLSMAIAFAGGQAKFIDEPNSYTLRLGEENYLTFNAPKRFFQAGKNEVDGHPAVRQGWGLGFYVSAHPTARGQDAMLYIEVLDDAGPMKLSAWMDEYSGKLADVLDVRAIKLDGKPSKPTKTKFAGRDAVTITYSSHPANAVVGGKPCMGHAWVFDCDKVRVLVSIEGQKDLSDPASLIDKAFVWSKKPPPKTSGVFKMLDVTYAVYRFMHFVVPDNCVPIYNAELGVLAAWNVLDKGEKIGVLRFKATWIDQQPLEEAAKGAIKVNVGGAPFFEVRDREKRITTEVAKSAEMLWRWEIETTETPALAKMLTDVEGKDGATVSAAKAQWTSAMDVAEATNYGVLYKVLGTALTWAVKP